MKSAAHLELELTVEGIIQICRHLEATTPELGALREYAEKGLQRANSLDKPERKVS